MLLTRLKELVAMGKKKKGVLEYKEIISYLGDIELDPDQIDKIYEYFESQGIDVLGAMEMDEEATIGIAEKMLSCIEQIQSFTRAPLYSHMTFKHTDGAYLAEMKQDLLKSFRTEETYGFLKGNERWEKLLGGS